MSQIVSPKDWFAVFKVNITVKDPFACKLSLMAHHHKVDCLVKRLDCSVVVKVKVTERLRIPVNVHMDDISSAAEHSVTKFGIVMHHHGPEYHARRLVCCLKSQGHSEGSYSQSMNFHCIP